MVVQNGFPIFREQPRDIANVKLAPIELAGELRLFLQKRAQVKIAGSEFFRRKMNAELRLVLKKKTPVVSIQFFPRTPVRELRLFLQKDTPVPAVQQFPVAPICELRLTA